MNREEKPYAHLLDRIMLYSSVFVLMGLSDAAIPILPELSDSTLLANGAASSLIFSSFFIGALITMMPFGLLSDAYGHRLFIILGIFLSLLSGMAIIISDNVWVIVAARFVEGAGCGAFFPAAFAMLSYFEKRGQYFGEFNSLLNLGLAAGMGMAGLLVATGTKNGLMLFEGLMVPVFMISIMVLVNNGPGNPVSSKHEIISALVRSKSLFIHTEYLQIWVLSFVLFGSSGVLIALYPDFSIGFLDKGALGMYLASVYLGAMVTSLLGGRFHVRGDNLVRAGMGITGVGALAAVFHPIGLTLMGAGSGLGLVGLVTGVSNLNIEQGQAMGIFNTFTYAGLAMVPLLSGLMLSTLGYSGVFILNVVLMMAMVFLPMGALKQGKI
ncbi:MAG: MFS transporter [ANME-2 cluster archaeon]|nr:MFS transporter [ANME-2 cluster archaeon]